MGERSRFSLPSLGLVRVVPGAPSVEEARAALGGRVSTEIGAGTCVHVTMKRGAPAVGVLVCVHATERDVWIGEGRFVRVQADAVSPLAEGDDSLSEVARDARRFLALREGDLVRYADRHGATREGTLVEKCRYGALVTSLPGKVVAVGFRQLSPAP